MKHPFQIIRLSNNGEYLFVVVQNHLMVFESKNGKLIGSWSDEKDYTHTLKSQQEDKIKALKMNNERKDADNNLAELGEKKSVKIPKIPVPGPGAPQIYNSIRALAISEDQKHLAITTDSDKAVVIFTLEFEQENCLHIVKRQPFPKRPSAISIDGDIVLVADKFGDVYEIKIDSNSPLAVNQLKMLLGHVSMLSDVKMVSDGKKKYVLSADRDEHIRLSYYPPTYVIKNFMFGHKQFVSTLCVPYYQQNILVSGGGDDFLFIWNWNDGKLLTEVPLRKIVEPYLNDSHLPPERFLAEKSEKEITVTRILAYLNPKTNHKLIIVLCENTPCIFVFRLNDDLSVDEILSFPTHRSLIDITVAKSNGLLVGAVDTESTDDLLKAFKFNDKNHLEVCESNVLRQISNANEVNVASRKDFYPLYHTNTLRKRGEFN